MFRNYMLLHLFEVFPIQGLNDRLLPIIIHNICWLETLLRYTPYMVSGIGEELGFFGHGTTCMWFLEYLLIFAILNTSFGD